MTATTTAEIVTLEAAVRVLQVGNRQITQSVASQLDLVDPWLMEAMGRVKVKGDTFAIGRDLATGDLVRASHHQCGVHRQYDGSPVGMTWSLDDPHEVSVRYSVMLPDDGAEPTASQLDWNVIDPPTPEAHPSCACCDGCTYTPTGQWNAVRKEYSYSYMPILPAPIFQRRYDADSQGWDLVEGGTKSRIVPGKAFETTVQGTAYIAATQDHTGTGNRYTTDWLSSLPLIVLAGLR